jgi:hypothetical protein
MHQDMDIGGHIADLVYEHDIVAVPGLGSFVARYRPAAVDAVEGKLSPPGKDVQFNPNLAANDGLLIERLEETLQVDTAEATKLVIDYARGVKEALERKETVVFPRLGRLYHDAGQALRFIPDAANFNSEAFGLPEVRMSPLAPSARAAAGTTAGASSAGRSSMRPSAVLSVWVQRYLPLIGALIAVLVGVGLFLFFQERGKSAANAEEADIPTSRYNVKPSVEDNSQSMEDIAEMAPVVPPDLDSEAATLPPGRKTAIIAIGLFSNQENVDRLVKRIFQAGYEPYTNQVRGYTQVGVQLAYEQEREVEQALETVRDKFDHRAFVLRRE